MKCYIINIDLKVDQFYELTGENIWRIPKKQSCLLSKYGGGYASSERPNTRVSCPCIRAFL